MANEARDAVANEARDAVVARFDGRATSYDDSAMHRNLAAAVAAFVDLGGVHHVLDVATGTGLVLRALPVDPTVRMVGVDLSPRMLAVAHAALPKAELVVADAAMLPLAGSCVDLVTCVMALHLMPDVGAVLREWTRVLRPGGRAVTATFGRRDGAAVHTHCSASLPFPVHPEQFSTPELMAVVAAPFGLAVVRHEWWTHEDDTVVIVELARTAQG
ncbi:MAG TPA: methyltransferase domain-containing protein [Cellulomonas sp.]